VLPKHDNGRETLTNVPKMTAKESTCRGDSDQIPTPPATETWFPLSHSQVLGSVVQTLDAAGTVLQNGCASDVSTRVP
jgi:hypothetical protein